MMIKNFFHRIVSLKFRVTLKEVQDLSFLGSLNYSEQYSERMQLQVL